MNERFDVYSGCDKILNFSFFRKCFTMRDYVLERSCEVLSLLNLDKFFYHQLVFEDTSSYWKDYQNRNLRHKTSAEDNVL